MASDTRPPTPAARLDPSPVGAAGAGRRRLNPATVVLWRAPGSVQLELGERSIVVEPVGPQELSCLLAPHLQRKDLDAADPVAVRELAELLDEHGYLTSANGTGTGTGTDAGYGGASDAGYPRTRLWPELGALTGRLGDAGRAVLQVRREATVAVHGTSRLAVTVATTLASAGVGHVQLLDGGDVRVTDACPGGLSPADEGRRFTAAANDALTRAAPDIDVATATEDGRPDLVLLTDPRPTDPVVRAGLHLDGLAHLSGSVDGSRAVIGPLVVPGLSSCLQCADLHRGERDPAWPALAVQLASRPRRRVTSEVSLCVATAGVLAGQALDYLDRQPPATLDASLEWQLPDWRLRRRSWPPHHSCECGAAKHGRMNT